MSPLGAALAILAVVGIIQSARRTLQARGRRTTLTLGYRGRAMSSQGRCRAEAHRGIAITDSADQYERLGAAPHAGLGALSFSA